MFDLFKTSNMLKITLIQSYIWFTASLVYYGLTLNSDVLIPGDLYINFAVCGLLEFPGYIFSALMLIFLGRKIPLSALLFVAGIALLVTVAVPTGRYKQEIIQPK